MVAPSPPCSESALIDQRASALRTERDTVSPGLLGKVSALASGASMTMRPFTPGNRALNRHADPSRFASATRCLALNANASSRRDIRRRRAARVRIPVMSYPAISSRTSHESSRPAKRQTAPDRSNPIAPVVVASSTSGSSSRRPAVDTRTAAVSGARSILAAAHSSRDRYPSRNGAWRRSSTRFWDSCLPRIRAIAASPRALLLDRFSGQIVVSHPRNVSAAGDRSRCVATRISRTPVDSSATGRREVETRSATCCARATFRQGEGVDGKEPWGEESAGGVGRRESGLFLCSGIIIWHLQIKEIRHGHRSHQRHHGAARGWR